MKKIIQVFATMSFLFFCVAFAFAQEKNELLKMTVHGKRVIEFRQSGVFLDRKQKIKWEISNGVSVGELETTEGIAYIIVRNISNGFCGHNEFSIVMIDEFDNVSDHQSPSQCVGEIYKIVLDCKGNENCHSVLTLGEQLSFDFKSKKWTKLSTKKTKVQSVN